MGKIIPFPLGDRDGIGKQESYSGPADYSITPKPVAHLAHRKDFDDLTQEDLTSLYNDLSPFEDGGEYDLDATLERRRIMFASEPGRIATRHIVDTTPAQPDQTKPPAL